MKRSDLRAAAALEAAKAKSMHALEKEKWEWRKQELTYLEAGQHLRALNQFLWQVPGMVIAVTGGIWFAASTVEAEMPRAMAFVFAGIFDFTTIPVILRLRFLIGLQIDRQLEFEHRQLSRGRYFVVGCWITLMATAGTFSFVAACFSETFSKAKDSKASVISQYNGEVVLDSASSISVDTRCPASSKPRTPTRTCN
ncbi:MAG: hypothetical protein JNM76_10010 [Betaproteobacteria bacterium]|nr:hypothetical protein [Betaproteobacteria bacterium]